MYHCFQSAWKKLTSWHICSILIANTCAVAYEGYAQGVIGIANSAPDYLNLVGIAVNGSGQADRVITQGGITSIYYLGTIAGCVLAGWLSDKFGRVIALQFGALWCILGIALEASAYNQPWIICARLIAGVGVAHMNCVAPTWVGVCVCVCWHWNLTRTDESDRKYLRLHIVASCLHWCTCRTISV